MKQKIIYIAGYGRSGSTLLDVILSNCEEVVGVGEAIFLFDEYLNNPDLPPFWKGVIEKLSADIKDSNIENIEKLCWDVQNHLKKSPKEEQEKYKVIWGNIFDQLFVAYPSKIILDSSKSSRLTFHRPLLLKEMGYDIKVIHLVRDPRAVMHSVSKGSNRLLEKGENPHLAGGSWRGLFSWIYVNTIVNNYYKAFTKDQIIRVRYEDIVETPTKTIGELMDFLGVTFPHIDKLEQGELELSPGIGISGNRMRRATQKIKLRKDYSWKNKLPLGKKIVAKILAYSLIRKFGYK